MARRSFQATRAVSERIAPTVWALRGSRCGEPTRAGAFSSTRSSCRNAVAFADLFPWISRPRMTFVALGRWSLAFSYHFCDPAQLALARSPALAQHRGG